MSSSDDFFKGLLFGTVVGVTAGLLLAPKSGEETRANIRRLAHETGDRAENYYLKARKEIIKKVEDIKDAGQNVDLEGYKKLVLKVVDEVKKDGEVTADIAKEIGMKLNDDWRDIKRTIL